MPHQHAYIEMRIHCRAAITTQAVLYVSIHTKKTQLPNGLFAKTK